MWNTGKPVHDYPVVRVYVCVCVCVYAATDYNQSLYSRILLVRVDRQNEQRISQPVAVTPRVGTVGGGGTGGGLRPVGVPSLKLEKVAPGEMLETLSRGGEEEAGEKDMKDWMLMPTYTNTPRCIC